jgi:hypothetical protein
MNKAKKFKIFFKDNLFWLIHYSNGNAIFRTEEVEEGFLVYYDVIVCIEDDSLAVMEDEYGKGFTYNMKEIYCLTEYVVEINQLDVFTIKSDTLFSNVNRHYEEGL